MAMIFNLMEKCHIIDTVTNDDAYGGATKGYRVGASIDAAIIKNGTTEAIVAEKQGVTEIFTVVTKSGSMLDYHSILRRDSDREYFVITSREKDSTAPAFGHAIQGRVIEAGNQVSFPAGHRAGGLF